jgi:hypothetical protein
MYDILIHIFTCLSAFLIRNPHKFSWGKSSLSGEKGMCKATDWDDEASISLKALEALHPQSLSSSAT